MRAILTYHSIDGSASPVSVAPDQWRAHGAFLASGAVRVLPLRELLQAPEDADAVALTFDDAFRNFMTEALPVLEEYGLPATVFAVADRAGATNAWDGASVPGIPTLPLMTWDELGQAQARGVEVGSHTRTHPHLPALAPRQVEDEVAGAAETFERHLGVVPAAFAYPYGSVDATSARIVGRIHAVACTTELRPLAAAEDPALLPRLDMYYLRDAGRLEQWGSTGFRMRLWVRARMREVRRVASGAPSRREVA